MWKNEKERRSLAKLAIERRQYLSTRYSVLCEWMAVVDWWFWITIYGSIRDHCFIIGIDLSYFNWMNISLNQHAYCRSDHLTSVVVSSRLHCYFSLTNDESLDWIRMHKKWCCFARTTILSYLYLQSNSLLLLCQTATRSSICAHIIITYEDLSYNDQLQ